ncbi:MAG: Uncharacterised protein [Prochlorococcus marinus str. MIT 9215]|nr:MAG: Uncharacterised protein [Prochlorococcus marinus str. MIT 9215]
MNPSTFEADGGDVAFSRIGPSAFQSLFEAIGIDQLHPLLNPPGLLTKAFVAEGGGDAGVVVAATACHDVGIDLVVFEGYEFPQLINAEATQPVFA